MRKIAIVGATPESFIQLALLVNNRRYDGKEKYGDDEFTLIHDPDKVYPYMLSGIGVAFQEVLEREIYFTKRWLDKYCDGVDSCGYKYVGWGNRRDKNFMVTGCSNTFDIEKFRHHFLEDGGKIFGKNVSIIQQKIDSFSVTDDKCLINNNEYDYVIDCTEKNPLGWEMDYMQPSVTFSNSAIMIEIPEKGHWNYTIEYAAKHGHIVGLPMRDSQRWIYLYDNTISHELEVVEDFKEIFPNFKFDETVNGGQRTFFYKEHSWIPHISNYIIHPENKRYMRNGTALLNIEPASLEPVQNQHILLQSKYVDIFIMIMLEKEKYMTICYSYNMVVILYKLCSLFYVLLINMVQDMTHHIGIELKRKQLST